MDRDLEMRRSMLFVRERWLITDNGKERLRHHRDREY